jgi:ferredoxin
MGYHADVPAEVQAVKELQPLEHTDAKLIEHIRSHLPSSPRIVCAGCGIPIDTILTPVCPACAIELESYLGEQ